MTKDEIIDKLKSMAKYPAVTLPRDTEALRLAASLLEQSTEQEPVAIRMDVIVSNLVREGINKHRARELAEHFIKYTQPQEAAPRKPLTDEEIMDICASQWASHPLEVARAIEAAHGIKENT